MSRQARPPTPRPTALVTGASSGIGRQFTTLLARSGNDLVLVARGKARLEALAEELCDGAGATVEVIAADLSLDEGRDTVARRIRDSGDVELLVNAAGAGYYGPLISQSPMHIEELIELNVTALSLLSRAALGPMVARRRGGIINISSTAAFVPGPRAAVYHACKAYVTSFTEALHEEARPHGVHVTALCPGVTPTGFQAASGWACDDLPSALQTDASTVARAGLAAIEHDRALCIPGLPNKLAAIGSKLAPRSAVRWGSRVVLQRL